MKKILALKVDGNTQDCFNQVIGYCSLVNIGSVVRIVPDITEGEVIRVDFGFASEANEVVCWVLNHFNVTYLFYGD